jgi:hypothetical protein
MKQGQSARVTWSDLKPEITRLDARRLASLVADLYRLSKENQAFLQARFAVGDKPLEFYRKIIGEGVCPDVCNNKTVQIAKGKKLSPPTARR